MSYPIFDKMTNRILYEKLDVTDFLVEGKNTIVFHIGGGWFCQHECIGELAPNYGDLMLCFKIMQGDRQIAESDDRVKYTKSYIRKSNIYYGEEHDARIGNYDFSLVDCDVQDWKNAEIIKRPLSVLTEQDCIPDKVIRTLKPKCIYSHGDIKLYDIGENVAGYAVIKFHDDTSHSGVCDIRYAENINDDFTLNFDSAGWESRVQKDRFIRDSFKTEFHTRFTWHGARYFEVIGDADVVEYRVTHTDLKQKVNFKSSNETLQWIFDAFIRTQLSNTHGCIPSDCPHRERLGYTGDGQLAAEAVMTCFDAEKMYRKWMQDVADSQDIYTGHVQHTAPFHGGGGGPGGWGGAIVFVPYSFYKFYNDKSFLEKYYQNMLNFLNYMELGFSAGFYAATTEEKIPFMLNTSLKFHNSHKISENSNFSYGALVRYGLNTKNESGLGTGLLFSYKYKKLLAGISSQFVFFANDDWNSKEANILKNGFALSYEINDFVNLNAWINWQTSFLPKSQNHPVKNAFDAGIETNVILGNSPCILNAKVSPFFAKDEIYLNSSITLSYLF
jgi:hypothetical protein